MATGSFSTQDDQRVVLLGKIGPGKSSLANRILSHEIFKTEEIGLCMRRQGEHAGRKLTVVDTPGWDTKSLQCTPEKIKQEIIRSATLCLPGPHALLLVLPISMDDQIPSANEIKSASHHVALLSHRAWRHTIVLFVCKDEMDTSAIDHHVQGAKKLIDKCEGRYFIFHNDSDVTALLQKIEDMVEENRGDFLIPQVSYEESEKRMQSGSAEQTETDKERAKQQHEKELGKQEQETNYDNTGETTKRSDSKESSSQNTTETSQGRAAVQDQDSDKETGAENEESEKNISSGTAEQTEKYEKRVEELKQQHKTECEKMEQNFREKLEELVNDYKSGVTSKRRNSNEFSPPNMAGTSVGSAAVQDPESAKELGAEKEKPEKRMPSGTAEQTETYEKREEELKQQHRTESEKMDLHFKEELGKLKREINEYKSGGTMKRGDSIKSSPQAMAETSQGGAAVQHLTLNEPFWVVMMAFSGALVGAIVGATDGVQGSAAGVIFGSTIGVLMAIFYIRATRVL